MKKVVIFGDSYSTFKGFVPNGYPVYYPQGNVKTAKDTWWSIFTQRTDYDLVLNDSWSGSTISYTGLKNTNCSESSSFIYRYNKLKKDGFFEKNPIDVVFVFGGTNDNYSGALLGEMKFKDFKKQDLFQVLPAICYFACRLKTDLPNTAIVFIINTNIKHEIQDCMEKAAEYYGIKSVKLQDIDKEGEHPTKKGMKDIGEQVICSLR